MVALALWHGRSPWQGRLFEALVPAFGVCVDEAEAINRRARGGELEAGVISAATYALVADRYRLLDAGGTFAEGHGPIVVGLEPVRPTDISARVVAIPGQHSTAALLLRLLVPEEPALVEIAPARIPAAVREGQADLGVVLPWELPGEVAGELVISLDLGAAWRRDTGLPVPLDVVAISRGLDEQVQRAFAEAVAASVRVALDDGAASLEGGAAREVAELTAEPRGLTLGEALRLALPSRERAADLGADGRAALAGLYRRARERGLLGAEPVIDPI